MKYLITAEQGRVEIDENLKLRTTTLSEEPVKNAETVWIDERVRYLEENWPLREERSL